MIELANTTSQPINIGDWFVSDSSSNLMAYQIAPGTVIAADGYYVLTEDYNFGALATSDPGRLVPFALNADGDNVYLSNDYGAQSGMYGGQPGGYQEHQSIPAMPPGSAYGLYTKAGRRRELHDHQHHAQPARRPRSRWTTRATLWRTASSFTSAGLPSPSTTANSPSPTSP